MRKWKGDIFRKNNLMLRKYRLAVFMRALLLASLLVSVFSFISYLTVGKNNQSPSPTLLPSNAIDNSQATIKPDANNELEFQAYLADKIRGKSLDDGVVLSRVVSDFYKIQAERYKISAEGWRHVIDNADDSEAELFLKEGMETIDAPDVNKNGWRNLAQQSSKSPLEMKGDDFMRLTVRKVMKQHSDGIDGGVDEIRTLFLRKHPAEIIVVADGVPSHFPFPDQEDFVGLSPLHLVASNGKSDCFSEGIADRFEVIDLRKRGEPIFSQAMPLAARFFAIEPAASGKNLTSLSLSVTSEEDFKGAKDCEVGNEVMVTERSYLISCDFESTCHSKMRSVKEYKRCQSIGGCD